MMDNEEDLYEAVISGVSGKYPLSDDIEELKEHLLAKKFLVTEDDCRWNREHWSNVPAATGKISVVKRFDDTFFGIYSGVAAMMDPLTRVTIERAFEAIMDAGINPKNMRNAQTAVYTACGTSDSEAVGCDEKLIAKFWLVAHARALLANRISYVLNLKGPSWTIDSSWLGGIECLKQAIIDIRKGRVESALVGVTNVILFPNISQHWVGLGKLSPDGSCFPFQENASGYARSESTVFLFLQRENEAKRIYAKLNKADTLFCGEESETILKPKEEAFVKFLRSFYEDVRAVEKPIAYVEADGSADKYLDEIELNSINRVLCAEKNNKNLHVGCVKGNLGHTEAASSLVSVSKALIALDSDIIPPNKSFRLGNKRLKISDSLNIVTKPIPFPEGKHVAVNAIGLGASIGHVLLEQYPKRKKTQKAISIPKLVLLSARHEPGLFKIIDKLEAMSYDDEYLALVNDVFKESIHGHFYRGYTILGGSEKKLHFTLETATAPKRPIWFVFGGMGSQWPGMGADLMAIPIFADAIKELDTYLAPLGIDIVNVISSYDPTVLKNVVNCFVGIVAVQIGVVDVLKALDIVPDAMFGHSLGENMCAYADGCFNKYQTIMAAYYRGRATSEISINKGLMASVGLNYKNLCNLPPNVEIACHNSDDNTTISGPFEEVTTYIEELKRQNIFVRVVNSNNVAYHSKQVTPLAAYVLENIRKVVPKPIKRSSRWISTSVPEKDWNSPLAQTSSAEYHVNNFKHTVYFAEACAHIPEDACVIEISPHGLFQGLLKRMVPGSCFVIPMGKRETSNALHFLLTSIGKLFVVGLQPNINAIYPEIEYPVSRGTPSLASLATWNHETEWAINTYPHREVGINSLNVSLREPKWRFLCGHKISEKVLMPFTTLLIETLQAYDTKEPILVFENITIPNYVEVSATDTATIYTQVQCGSGNFEITKDEMVLLSGALRYSQESLPEILLQNFDDDNKDNEFGCTFTKKDVQKILKQYAIEISEELLPIQEITFTDYGCFATIIWNENLATFILCISMVKVFWDLCKTNHGPILPSKFLKFAIETEKYNSMSKGSEVKINYFESLNTFVGSGVQLCGLENSDNVSSFSLEEKLLLQDMRFVCHENPQTKTLENFFILCAQIIGENFGSEIRKTKYDRSPSVKILLTNELKNDAYFKKRVSFIFENKYRMLPEVQIVCKYATIEDLKNVQNGFSEHTLYFVISNSNQAYIDEVTKVASCTKNIFLLTLENIQEISDDFVKVTEERIEKSCVALWKKKVSIEEKIIRFKPFGPGWLDYLEKEIRHLETYDSIILHWHSKYVIEIHDVISKVNKIKTSSSFRYIIETGENSLSSSDYREHLEKGLVTNVLQNNEWGSVRYLMAQNLSPCVTNTQIFPVRNKYFKNIDVDYTTIHCETSSAQKNIKVLEFSGTTTTDRKKVMGIACFHKDQARPQVFLTWPIPENWSSENAATIPFAYLKAYYALIVKGRFFSHSTVLVHHACTVIGEALIAVALSFECTVYASVDNSRQSKYLQERFDHSSHLVVLNSEVVQIDVEILRITCSVGVDIVANPETEQEVQSSTACVKSLGKLIVLSEIAFRSGNQVGLGMFVKNTTMYSVVYEEVIKCEECFRLEFQTWLTDSMTNGLVKPFDHNMSQNVELDSSKKFANKIPSPRVIAKQEFDSNSQNGLFTCHPEKTYLVIGNKNEIWYTVVTWLVKNNAKRLALINEDSDDYYNQYIKRFNLYIENRTDLSLMYMSPDLLLTQEDTSEMIREMNAFAELDVVFCISLNSLKCQFIDQGIRKHGTEVRQMVCLQCDASTVCESRIQASLPALNIIWDQSITETVALYKNIGNAIQNSTRKNSSFFYISQLTCSKGKLENWLMNKDNQFFPHYSEADELMDSFSSGDASFRKLVSKCSYYSTRTQLFPIFILPGLHAHRLKSLVHNLMYPVFCAKYSTAYTSANANAKSLIEPLKRIQPQGPYTIVGESWSGAVAIELVSLLEKDDPNVKINLILLEGLPRNSQARLSSLGLFGSPEFFNSLYEICFENLKMEKSHNNRSKQSSDKKRAAFSELLQRKLTITKNYSSEKAFLRSKVIAINLMDQSVLDTYIDFEEHFGHNFELKTLDEENYEELLRSKITSNIINDNVLFKW